ncbi:hypothetical protein Hanom_Chr03g00253211 [Helianthus anomalus]
MFEMGQTTYNSGRKDDYGEGRAAAMNNEKTITLSYSKRTVLPSMPPNAGNTSSLSLALGDEDREAGGASTSR